MSEEEFLDKKKNILKKTINNIYFYILVIAFILCVFYYYRTENVYSLYGAIVFLVLMLINIFMYVIKISRLSKDTNNKRGDTVYSWEPLTISNQEFIKVAKTGLPKTYIDINGTTHEIIVELASARMDTVKVGKCYIDGIEFNRFEDAINFVIYAGLSINTMKEIKILSCNNSNPRKFFR